MIRLLGRRSRKSWSRLGARSADCPVTPVTLPPGLARLDHTSAHRIADREHDRDGRRYLLQRERCQCSCSRNQKIGMSLGELRSQLWQPLLTAFGRPVLEEKILPLDISQFL